MGERVDGTYLVKCADWCQENDGRSYTGTGSAMVPSVKAQAAMRSPKQSTTRIGRRRERILCDNISTYRLRNRVPTLVAVRSVGEKVSLDMSTLMGPGSRTETLT